MILYFVYQNSIVSCVLIFKIIFHLYITKSLYRRFNLIFIILFLNYLKILKKQYSTINYRIILLFFLHIYSNTFIVSSYKYYIWPNNNSFIFLKYNSNILALFTSFFTVKGIVLVSLSFSINVILPTLSPFFIGASKELISIL